MSFDYAAAQQDAVSIISEFMDPSITVTLTMQAAVVYDPKTGSSTQAAPTTKQVYAVMVPWDQEYIDGKKFQWNQAFKDATAIEFEEINVYMAPLAKDDGSVLNPSLGDILTFGGTDYVIQKMKPLKPSGTFVLHDLTVRA